MLAELSVSKFCNYIKQIFDAEEMLKGVSIVGEITSLSNIRGVTYFSIKDEGATLSCVCFFAMDQSFKNGDKVVVVGSPNFYAKGGKLNFNVSKITLKGEGEQYQKFLELKAELQNQGYFENKKDFPKNIKRIGVVTSKEGAVIQDIINIRNRRNPFIDIVLYAVRVQGNDAEKEISKAIDFFSGYANIDAVIVARGGGSFEDLMPFNSRAVAQSIHDCKKFVVSAVGHETDYTICDMCSDLRAPTPTAASELLCIDTKDYYKKFEENKNKLNKSIWNVFVTKQQYLAQQTQNIYNILKNLYNKKSVALKTFTSSTSNIVAKNFQNQENACDIFSAKIEKLNPEKILKLGYSRLMIKNTLLNSVKGCKEGDVIEAELKDGKVCATITNVKQNKSNKFV